MATGYRALYLDTNGYSNEADGYEALFNDSTGFANVANGYAALYSDSSGALNVAEGFEALYEDTSGAFNIGIGYFAGGAVTTGTNNIAIGSEAGVYNNTENNNIDIGSEGALGDSGIIRIGTASTHKATYLAGVIYGNGAGLTGIGQDVPGTGSYNTATGGGALQDNSTGSDNTATGYDAMGGTGSKTGGGNTADGVNALSSLTTGYNSEAIGLQALYADTTGFDNVAIGVSDFYNLSTGYQNTACGTYAFQNMTSGYGNVGLGYYAGNTLVSGDNNIYIGNSGASSENNVIRIGSSQTATYFSGEFISVAGLTPVNPYVGDDGSGNDVQIGSLKSGITNVSCYNEADKAYMQLYCSAITVTGGSDLAEPFRLSKAKQPIVEGDVVVIDKSHPGQLTLSDKPYDKRVAGVVSGANGVHPGIQMHQEGLLDGGQNVALSGRVYVEADTSNGPIEPGDMLTTSGTPGRAMKVTDSGKAEGAILGKAMSSLDDGQGMVLVLVTLQ